MSFPEEKEATIKIIAECGDKPTIVELGSQTGEDMAWILKECYDRGKVPRGVMVEADHENFMKLVSRGIPGHHLYVHGAVADRDGERMFWENHSGGCGYGSIYDPLPGLGTDYSAFKLTGPVPCFTFDNFCKEHKINTIDLLRADIHGAEKDMIAYGQEALARTRYLYVECFETPLYEGMAIRIQLLEMLPGWSLVQRFPWNMLLRNDKFEEAT